MNRYHGMYTSCADAYIEKYSGCKGQASIFNHFTSNLIRFSKSDSTLVCERIFKCENQSSYRDFEDFLFNKKKTTC